MYRNVLESFEEHLRVFSKLGGISTGGKSSENWTKNILRKFFTDFQNDFLEVTRRSDIH